MPMKAMLVLVPIAATAKEMVMGIMIKVMLTIVMVLMIISDEVPFLILPPTIYKSYKNKRCVIVISLYCNNVLSWSCRYPLSHFTEARDLHLTEDWFKLQEARMSLWADRLVLALEHLEETDKNKDKDKGKDEKNKSKGKEQSKGK